MASHSALLDYLDREAGRYHRGSVRYGDQSTELLHLRTDIREHRLMDEIDSMIDHLRRESTPDEVQSFPFGSLHATVRRFEEAIVLHFPTGENRGVVVALEPETARDLNTFIGECEKRIRG